MTTPNRSFRLATLMWLPAGAALVLLPGAARGQAPAGPAPQPAKVADDKPPAEAKPAEAKPAEAKPAKPPIDENILRAYRQQRDNLRNGYAGVPDAKDATLAGLVRFSQQKGVIRVAIGVPPVAGTATGQTSQRFKIPGVNAGWQVSRSQFNQSVIGPNGQRTLHLVQSVSVQRTDLDAGGDGDIYQTSLSSSGTTLSLYATSVLGRVTFMQNLAARNNAAAGVRVAAGVQPVTLTVTELQGQGQSRVVFRGSARSVDELRSRHPEEFRRHLIPVLARMSDLSFLQPGASDVYSVFPEVPADPRATARVEALLPELDSDAFEVREAASRQLLDLGPSAVLAALRLDRASLSDEQVGQLGKLIAAHRRRDLTDPVEARKDASFLADCLEHDDPAVRVAARAQLEAALGAAVAFDPSLSGAALGEAADGVRKQIAEARANAAAAANAAATQPATQPAGAGR